jgi:electron transport complex protein RnfC
MRRLHTFHGGIHPPENKRQSLGRPIADAGIPPELVLPLSQHIGAPAEPLVAPGDKVLKGQIIAAAKGFVSVPVHAPTSGTLVAIEDRPVAHPSGLTAPCAVIASDGLDRWTELHPVADYRRTDKTELLAQIADAGIAGMGGAGFPTVVKLSLKPGVRIDTLIINGTECEPYITADDALMRERAAEIVEGTEILRHLVEPGETLIGVEDNKPEAIAALQSAVRDTDIEVVVFPTKYPSGGERQLIEILTGKQVPSGGLPSDVGVVCQNVGSAAAVRAAVVEGRPLISRITTVTGEAVEHPGNFEVLLGTPMRYLLEKAGYRPQAGERLIMGGPMMGFTVASADVPVVKTTNCLLAPSREELPTPLPAQACIRCGLCAEACPATLLPQQLYWFAQGKEFDKLEQHHLFDCIECGACSWVCPSHIPLVQYYRASKAEILQARRDSEKAEHSRIRFEARQERLEREAADKEERRAARKAAAEQRARLAAGEGEAGTEDPVQAAIERARARKAAQQAESGEADDREKLEEAVIRTRRRLATAEEKLAQATAEGSDLVAALQTGVEKTRAKLAAAEQALNEFLQTRQPADEPVPAAPVDAAQAAIDRALAARAAATALSPEQQARQALEKLEQRLAKSRARLAESRDAGEEEKVIIALEATVARLEGKVNEAREELTALEDA